MADEKQFSLKDDPTFKQMVSVISALGAGLKDARTQNEALNAKVGELTETLKTRQNGNEDKKSDLSDEQLNDMPQSEFLKHINQSIAENIAKATGAVKKDIDKVSDSFQENKIREDLKNFAKDHPDIADLTEEIKSIIEDTPGLSISRAYALAKTENPEKVKTLDEKYKPADDPAKKQPFGGLTPTSGTAPMGDDGKPLTQEKAADKAWDDTLGKFPGIKDILSE